MIGDPKVTPDCIFNELNWVAKDGLLEYRLYAWENLLSENNVLVLLSCKKHRIIKVQL